MLFPVARMALADWIAADAREWTIEPVAERDPALALVLDARALFERLPSAEVVRESLAKRHRSGLYDRRT
jgi:hypothetical protein